MSLSATDVDGDAITFSSPNLPFGAELEPQTGLFRWAPDYDQHGDYEIELVAGDGEASTSRVFNLEVTNLNGQVEFEPLDAWSISEGQTLWVYVRADDPDNQSVPAVLLPDGTMDAEGISAPLDWQHTALPAGATFDFESQMLWWTPGFDQAGLYQIDFTVTDDGDGTGSSTTDTASVFINVRDANGTPQVGQIANQAVDVGQTLQFDVSATDPDGDPLVLEAVGLPDFAVFTDHGDGTGTIDANPAHGDRGDYTITVRASDDGHGDADKILTGTGQFVLSADSDNDAPQLSYVGPMVALVGQELMFAVTVSDLDEDPLTFSADKLPVGATFEGTGIYGRAQFSWIPTAGDVGTSLVTLRATDSGNGDAGNELSDTQLVSIDVRTTNIAPVLVPVGAQQAAEGQQLTISLASNDGDGDTVTYSAEGLPRGASFDPQAGEFVWTPDYIQAGGYSVRFQATDGNLSSWEDVAITVAGTNQPPVISPVPDVLAQEGLMLRFNVAGGDLDPGQTVSFFAGGDLPAGAEFDPLT